MPRIAGSSRQDVARAQAVNTQPTSSPLAALTALAKRRGFIFPGSELYGGLNGFWDYGPLGVELKRQIREAWWKDIVQKRDDVVGLDTAIVMHPRVWDASGHTSGFVDPMVDCLVCRRRHKADALCEEQGLHLLRTENGFRLPEGVRCACGSNRLTEPRAFNLMFKTFVGPVEDASALAYLRPETAQGIFINFNNVVACSRQKVPFGIAQIGKAFRNEINPRNYTFRSREFEQMELEFFIRPDEAVDIIAGCVASPSGGYDKSPGDPSLNWGWECWLRYWVDQRMRFYASIGLPPQSLVLHEQNRDELAHYARACVDIQFTFPFGVQELEGIAARGDFDLRQHQRHSGKSHEYFDEQLKAAISKWSAAEREAFVARCIAREQARGACGLTADACRVWCQRLFEGCYLPHVIEPSAGVDRIALAVLCHAYREEWVSIRSEEAGEKPRILEAQPGLSPPDGYELRTLLRLHPRIAPIKAAVFPLLRNRPEQVARARAIFDHLRSFWPCFFDIAGAIGRRYRRQDEIGTPFSVTVDFRTLEDHTVTLRDRDTMEQIRVAADSLPEILAEKIR